MASISLGTKRKGSFEEAPAISTNHQLQRDMLTSDSKIMAVQDLQVKEDESDPDHLQRINNVPLCTCFFFVSLGMAIYFVHLTKL